MSRKYLRSDMSDQEAHFFTCGHGLFGEENTITSLFKLVGKYDELKAVGKENEIAEYSPKDDYTFKFENKGYTAISTRLRGKEEYKEWHISRKYLKYLSRKWCLTPVIIHFESDCIISELIAYIREENNLQVAADKYLKGTGTGWLQLMPIQFDFLSTRHTYRHKDYEKAGEIINNLAAITF